MGRFASLLVFLTMTVGCASGGGSDSGPAPRDTAVRDSGRRDSGPRDSGRRDSGPRDSGTRDSGPPTDTGPTLDSGTPPDTATPVDTGVDTMPPVDSGPRCPIVPGTLSIVEVMISSRSGSGDRGEWFEIQSNARCAVTLTGLSIVSPTPGGIERVHDVGGSTVIGPDQHYVFALSSVPAENHDVPFDYAYGTGSGDVILDNGPDWLEIRIGMTAIDRVQWPSSGFTHGRARQFPAGMPADRNALWSRWCNATAEYPMTGSMFYGTPGAVNGTCP